MGNWMKFKCKCKCKKKVFKFLNDKVINFKYSQISYSNSDAYGLNRNERNIDDADKKKKCIYNSLIVTGK